MIIREATAHRWSIDPSKLRRGARETGAEEENPRSKAQMCRLSDVNLHIILDFLQIRDEGHRCPEPPYLISCQVLLTLHNVSDSDLFLTISRG